MNQRYASLDEYGFRNLPIHLARNRRIEKLRELLLDFGWLEAKLDVTKSQLLIDDYDLLLQFTDVASSSESKYLKLLQGALRLSANVLDVDLSQLPCQLTGRLLGFEEKNISKLLEQVRREINRAWLRPLHPCFDTPGGALIRTIAAHQNNILAVAITPNGSQVISASADKTLKVWNLESDMCDFILSVHEDMVESIAVLSDGQHIISASSSTLKLWNLDSGLCVRTKEFTKRIHAMALLPNEHQVMLGLGDGTLKIWDLESDVYLSTLVGHTSEVTSVAVTMDGKRAVSGQGYILKYIKNSRDDITFDLKVWDLESGACIRTLVGHTSDIDAVAPILNGQEVISASKDATLRVWDLESGECLGKLIGHTSEVRAVVITSDGRKAISCSADMTIKIWDLESGKCIRTLKGHSDIINDMALTPDGQQVVSASRDGTLKVWKLDGDNELFDRLHSPDDHTYAINDIALTPDGQRMVSASRDGTLKIWDIKMGRCLFTLKGQDSTTNSIASVKTIALTPDGKLIVSGSGGKFGARDGTLKVWDIENGNCIRTMKGRTDSFTKVVVTPDGRWVISGSDGDYIKIWDIESGNCIRYLEHSIHAIFKAMTPDGRRVIAVLGLTTIKVWDTVNGTCIRNLEGHKGDVRTVVAAPDSQMLFSGSMDKTIKVWDIESGHCIRTLKGHKNGIAGLAVISAERLLISWSFDGNFKVWDIESGKCVQTLDVDDKINSVAVTPDGQQVAFGAGDKALKVWNLKNSSNLVRFVGNGVIRCISITSDSSIYVAGDAGGKLYCLCMENSR